MARPQKAGLDYFALDVKMNDKVELIEALHGIEGFAILVKLYQKIYSEGYFYEWGEKEQILFCNGVSVDRNKVVSIVSDCIKWDIFDKRLYETYGILTSKRIQNQYISATYKRVNVEMIEEYLLIDVSDRSNITYIRVSDIRNEDTSMVSDSKSTQSKVKKSKVKKSKEYIKSDLENPTENTEQDVEIDINPLTPQEIIYKHWNNKKIIQHRRMTDKIKRSINGALRDYEPGEICQAIDNYHVILTDDKYYWSYRWGLREFLQRGLDKFMDFEIAAQNYIDKARGDPIPENLKNALELVEKTQNEENDGSIWEVDNNDEE